MNGPVGHILYDDTCGFCRGWVPKWTWLLRRLGLEPMPLQHPWVKEREAVPMAELMRDIFLLFDDGRIIRGADVYRYVTRRVWWLLPIYVLSTLPGLSGAFDWCYRRFADHRHKISKACKLPVSGGGTANA